MGRLSDALLLNADFAGATYIPALDKARLTGQLLAVYNVMSDGQWHTLPELADKVRGSQTGVSARLRQLRNDFGCTINSERLDGGFWHYRLTTV